MKLLSDTIPIEDGGLSSNNSSFILFLGNMKAGSMTFPPALMPQTAVTLIPLSAHEILLTHLLPVVESTLGGLFGTVENQDSSIL